MASSTSTAKPSAPGSTFSFRARSSSSGSRGGSGLFRGRELKDRMLRTPTRAKI